jgi:hypothetical protein
MYEGTDRGCAAKGRDMIVIAANIRASCKNQEIDNGQLTMDSGGCGRMKLARTPKPNSGLESQASRINVVEVLRIRAQAKDTKRSRDITDFRTHMDILPHWFRSSSLWFCISLILVIVSPKDGYHSILLFFEQFPKHFVLGTIT